MPMHVPKNLSNASAQVFIQLRHCIYNDSFSTHVLFDHRLEKKLINLLKN